jgi:hypothetical protein
MIVVRRIEKKVCCCYATHKLSPCAYCPYKLITHDWRVVMFIVNALSTAFWGVRISQEY